jgi:peptidoglycan/xylan/chitin deacetylase (PgdA/CDA1 family)
MRASLNLPTEPIAATIILMYHALAGSDSPASGQDTHYSVEAERFDAHLRLLGHRAGGCASARDWLAGLTRSRALLTFDDGHLSNYSLALPLLVKHAAYADFFINPKRVGTPGFASWTQLAEMAAAGMSIQSHGWNHRYFTVLTADELREDLTRSRQTIEDRLGQPVTLLAPPGGRVPAHLADIARECGYTHVLGSRPGRVHDAHATLLPRMAVTASLDETTLDDWLAGRGVARARLRYAALGFAKRALGDRGYERLRARLLGPTRSDA